MTVVLPGDLIPQVNWQGKPRQSQATVHRHCWSPQLRVKLGL